MVNFDLTEKNLISIKILDLNGHMRYIDINKRYPRV